MSAVRAARLADAKVGAFVLIALAILIAGSLWLAGSAIGSPRVDYHVKMKNAGGLQPGDRVQVSGVSVGRVEAVELRAGEEWPVELKIQIKRSVPLKIDAEATLGTAGLLGATLLELRTGTPGAPPLAPGGEIHGVPPAGIEQALANVEQLSTKAAALLDQLSVIFDNVSDEIDPLLAKLNRVLSEENATNLEHLLADLRRTTGDAGPRLNSLLERADGLVARLDQSATNLPELTADVQGLVVDLRTAFGPGGERLAAVLDRVESSLGRADAALGVVGSNRDEIDATLRDLRDTLTNLRDFSQQVKQHPYSLVRIRHVPDRKPGDSASAESK
jgi:phospholipid/cholesterol/gamma-HCH transport system substrate-binding protein